MDDGKVMLMILFLMVMQAVMMTAMKKRVRSYYQSMNNYQCCSLRFLHIPTATPHSNYEGPYVISKALCHLRAELAQIPPCRFEIGPYLDLEPN